MEIIVAGHTLVLLPQKAIWDPETQSLLIADCHLGKIEHFRASGIGLPIQAADETIHRLQSLLDVYKPKNVIFLGDLFHSRKNDSFYKFEIFIAENNQCRFSLIPGNHDILSNEDYLSLGLNVHPEMILGNLWLTHEPQDVIREGLYNLAGHIHPGIRIKGKAKQSITLPCFHFGQHTGILPAFGYFTGKYLLKTDGKCNIFAISENNIYNLSPRL